MNLEWVLKRAEIDCNQVLIKQLLQKIASILTNGSEIVRHRFPFISMRIFLDDFMCLMDDGFVNDTIMDFCLNDLVFK